MLPSRVEPPPSSLAVHAARAAPRRDKHTSWEGFALPPAGGMGKPGFPIPLRKGCALPNPGGGMGEPGSPTVT